MKNGTERLKVGLLISHLEDDFDSAVCEGAMLAAEHSDVNLFILPGRYVDGVYADKLRTEYEYQYNTLFDLPTGGDFDLLLVLIGTIGSHLDHEHKKAFVDRYKGTPVITITAEVDGYPCLTVDNKTGLVEVMEHLINDHGCRSIGFVSGPNTSDDANARLRVYKEVLAKHDIPYDDGKVVYGNFSKYVEKQAGDLIDRNPGLEAIVFANDQMAYAGYKAMRDRGIRPGRDILVTGFDNDPICEELVPYLTTVKSDVYELGYNALIEGLNLLKTGKMEKTSIPSSMVKRNSCGCRGNPRLASLDLSIIDGTDETNVMADRLSHFLYGKYRQSEETRRLCGDFKNLVLMIDRYINSESLNNKMARDMIVSALDNVLSSNSFKYIVLDDLFAVIEYLHNRYTALNTDPDTHSMINRLFVLIYKVSAERNAAYARESLEDNYNLSWQTSSITRDMLIFEAYDDRSYQTVVDKLVQLHMDSSYLFIYEPEIVNRKTDTFRMPDYLKLKSWHNRSEAVLQPSDEQLIRSDSLFTNKYLPQDRRYTMVLSPLFSNEEHYGLLMCELRHEYFVYIRSVTAQLCAALKIITMMKREAKTSRALRRSLIEIEENNEFLSHLSRQDELTGCLNRRGFFEKVRGRLKEDRTEGIEAVMIFADLDSLKTINDRFGHTEGDFAIRSAAEILRRSFEGTDYFLGRIGGDEFVICVFEHVGDTVSATDDDIRQHIDVISKEFNSVEARDKQYIVHTSVGVYSFICTPDVEITELLSHADSLLYEQKKHKKSILK
ncbi:MAG: GGDEF domain-containing protein [Ruminococcus sp.]|nr:GGDEF domain-containing protein [Ruminococcus sp.]